jgi:hypothetical protein
MMDIHAFNPAKGHKIDCASISATTNLQNAACTKILNALYRAVDVGIEALLSCDEKSANLTRGPHNIFGKKKR